MNTWMDKGRGLLIAAVAVLAGCQAATAQSGSAATGSAPDPATIAPGKGPAPRPERWVADSALQRHFTELGTQGTLVLMDTRQQRWIASDSRRAFQGFLPASTFKIPMSLIALETGAAKDESHVFAWDGQKRWLADWNRDQTLASAYKVSAVWVFQRLAREVGPARVQQFLYDFRYGNALAGPVPDRFWLDGDLRISAVQQIDFLRRLHGRALPLSDRTYDIARKVLLRDQGPGWKLYAKTGWADDTQPALGWFVGWLETDADPRPVFFALNMDLVKDGLGEERIRVVRQVLKERGYMD